MQYSDLSRKFQRTNHQHNIMAVIGNGFDINMLNRYGCTNKNGQKVLTKYSSFYTYYKQKNPNDDNVLVKAMEKARDNGESDWADFERWIPKVIEEANDPGEDLDKVSTDLHKIQINFSTYLSTYVNVCTENKVGENSHKDYLAIGSLMSFLGDLDKDDYGRCLFPSYVTYYDIYNFLFVNLNFTNLLDNYIYLDHDQFDPNVHATVDTNCYFIPNIHSYPDSNNVTVPQNTNYSSYLHATVIHPHGNQHIARSLLFGANDLSLITDKKSSKFNKEYWVQYSKYYVDLFKKTRLFIIYGSSLGESDTWWWSNILSKIASDINNAKKMPSELLIYWYYDPNTTHYLKNKKFDKEAFVKEFVDKYAFKIDPKTGNIINFDSKSNKTFEIDPELGRVFDVDPNSGKAIDIGPKGINYDSELEEAIENNSKFVQPVKLKQSIIDKIKARISVIPFTDANDVNFLSLKPKKQFSSAGEYETYVNDPEEYIKRNYGDNDQ